MNDNTIVEIFQKTAQANASKRAIMTLAPHGKEYVEINFGELEKLSNQVAAGLVHLGVKPGQKIGILSKPRPEWAACMLGILKAGAIAVPIDPLLVQKEIHRLLGACDISGLIVAGDHYSDVEVTPMLDFVVSMDADRKPQQKIAIAWKDFLRDKPLPARRVRLEDLAIFLNTSGTTGNAKPVMLAHRNFVANLTGVMERLEITPSDVIISIAPWNHSFGLIVLFAACWTGATLIYTNDYANLAKIMLEHEPTILVAVPKLFHAIYQRVEQNLQASFVKKMLTRFAPKLIGKQLKRRLAGGRLRFFASGSAPLSPKVMEGFRRLGLGMIEGYGMTEATPVLTFSTPFNKKVGSVGPPLSNVQLKLIEQNEEGIGELLATGPNIMLGYYKNEARTREVLDNEGWLHTGDLASLDDDGWVYIRGRKKNVIVLDSGKNVYPEEVEWEVGRIPLIEDVLVRRAERKGVEVIQALIYPKHEELPPGLSKEEIKKLIWDAIKEKNPNLAQYKRIKSDQDIVIVDEPFEKTSLKDIKRYKYQEQTTTKA
ncbi:AMP-binding protein [Candidatus Acetothermia bacterium]|nr:AMP-binding protein [Candidatus Acetothermia bacterium]MBI3643439.1 AMP-binding protein [Candidatus Acetothermia bacterium]